MNALEGDRVLRLAPGCRLSVSQDQEDVLLMPESVLKLKGPARAILELCDGTRTLPGIVEELKRKYPAADATRIESETADLLGRLRDRGAVEYGAS
ncbi:MAG TPA: pyrroloquinoline quinone biosynthesis peptide chaperone PqqD [Terriglobia bacterium]|nr:pyrroloquinoline quinone biosynthesis peptide chaperone PqqD [Terriglobia bacterium]